MTIKCIRYLPVNKGAFLGFADFEIHKMGISIHGCKVYTKEGRKWVSLPDKEYTNPEGEKKYAPIVRLLNPDHFKPFCAQLLQAFEQWVKENAQPAHSESGPWDEIKEEECPF